MHRSFKVAFWIFAVAAAIAAVISVNDVRGDINADLSLGQTLAIVITMVIWVPTGWIYFHKALDAFGSKNAFHRALNQPQPRSRRIAAD